MIDPVVRPARQADVDALRLLEGEARAALVDARGGTRWLDEHPEVGAEWPDALEEHQVFVAVLDVEEAEVVVGYLVLDVAGTVARIDQVFVTPGAREVGFGDALIEGAEGAAREGARPCSRVRRSRATARRRTSTNGLASPPA